MTKKTKNTLLTLGALFIGWQIFKPKGSGVVGASHGKVFKMGDDFVYIGDGSGIALDNEVCLFLQKDNSLLKCISNNQLDLFIKQGKLSPVLDEVGKPNIRYEFETNKDLNEFVKNEPPKNRGRNRNHDFSLNGHL